MLYDPFGHLEVFRIRWFGDGVVDFVVQVGGYALYSPKEVGIGVCHIEAYVSGEVAEEAYVGVPRVGDRAIMFVVGKEEKVGRGIHLRIVFR